jgi:hypothetical protein
MRIWLGGSMTAQARPGVLTIPAELRGGGPTFVASAARPVAFDANRRHRIARAAHLSAKS